MGVYYLDTSAALKLLHRETDSLAFARFYDAHVDDVWISSKLLRVELIRAVRRALPTAIDDARGLLGAFDFLDIDDEVIAQAMDEPDPLLRSPDALHLAAARTLGDDLDGLVTYDARLDAAAKRAGMAVVQPRD